MSVRHDHDGLFLPVGVPAYLFGYEVIAGQFLLQPPCLEVVAVGGILYLLATLRLAHDLQRVVDIALDRVYQAGVLLQLTVPVLRHPHALLRQTCGKSHLKHLDARGDLDDQPFLSDGIRIRGDTVLHHHSLAGQTLLVSRGGDDLPQGLLRVVNVMREILLTGDVYRVLAGVIVRHPAAVRAHGNHVPGYGLHEGVEPRPQFPQLLLAEALPDAVAVLFHGGFILLSVHEGQEGLVDVEQRAYLAVMHALVSAAVFGGQLPVFVP